MAKSKAKSQKKKRSKSYTGEDAAVKGTKITRVTAPDRGRFAEWWNENRTRVAFWGFVIGASLIIFWLLRLVVGWIF